MPTSSAGILVVRMTGSEPEFLLVHPGGPYWAKKDLGAWSIPKGEFTSDEDAEAAAQREFEEELGVPCPAGERLALGSIKQPSGKVVTAWCIVGDLDVANISSNTFDVEWPPRSGRTQSFPEIDRAEFFSLAEGSAKILPGQRDFLQAAIDQLDGLRRPS